MSNSYYNHTTYPTPNSPGSSAQLRAELENITAGFALLPTLAANNYKVAMINSAGTAMIASSALQSLAITSSTINSTSIGASTAAAGTFTSLTVTGTSSLGSTTVITGGTINGTPIGGTTPSTGAFTTISASSGFTGALIGNVTGNLTGNVTGNVVGNLNGNLTASSGTSAFNNVTISGSLDMDAGTSNTIINLATPINSGDAATKGYTDTGLALKLNLSGGTMSGAIAMGTSKITGLGEPTLTQDAATKNYADTGLALKLNLTGGTMSGAIAMATNKVTGLGDPTSAQDAATKTYVDTADALKLNLSGGTMSGSIALGTNRITGVGDPTAAQDAATKNYVDNTVQGLDAKASCIVATTANITLSGTQTIDGQAVAVGDRVLVKDQSTQANNGIYVCAVGSWTRATDVDTWSELVSAFSFVEKGIANSDSGWVCSVDQGGTLGITAITWVQFSGAGQITAGAGLTKTGNTLDVGTASSSRILVNADNIDLATTAVTAGTYQSMTVDAYGRVTAGTNPTTLSGYNISNAYTTTQVDAALALKLNLTGGTLSGAIAMGTSKITGLGDPTLAQDATTKTYVDSADALKLNLTGGTMSGVIAMGTSKITGLGNPTTAQDAATKTYVDTADALKLNLTGGTMAGAIAMGSSKITGLADPTSAQDATTKIYVDGILGSATSASTSAAAAAVSATNAGNSATASATSASASASSATSALSSLNTFRGQYYGPLSTDPTLDPLGSAMTSGDLYFNTAIGYMKVFDGTSWLIAYLPASGYLALGGGTMTGAIAFAGAQTWPTFNQNTTGTAAGLSSTLAVVSGGTGVTTSTGTGSAVLSISPTLITPLLGTPASGNFSVGTFTWPTFNQNTTGTAAGLSSTLVVSSGGTGVTTSTGSGANVLSTSPTLVTPLLGTPTSGNFSTGTFTWPTFNQNTSGTAAGLSATLAIASGGTAATTAAGALASLGAYSATNPSGYTTNTGTVTSVAGTGNVNGLTLTGTVTSSGNLTLGGTLSGVANAALINSSVTVNAGTGISGGGSVALGSSVTLTNAGVTSITAGTGIAVSASTGGVTISSAGGASLSIAQGYFFTSF